MRRAIRLRLELTKTLSPQRPHSSYRYSQRNAPTPPRHFQASPYIISTCEGKSHFQPPYHRTRPWRNWIAHRSSEPRVAGSNPAGRAFVFLGFLRFSTPTYNALYEKLYENFGTASAHVGS